MDIFESLDLTQLPEEAEIIRKDIRQSVTDMMAEADSIDYPLSWFKYNKAFTKELGRRGWIGLTIPKKYGGGGKDAFARYVVAEELLNCGAPVGLHWITDRQTAPLILRFGTEEQKQKYLPPICSGDLAFCIGMSEPNSGSDLASIKTRARRSNGGWIVNGQKIWTSYAHVCQNMLALVRTSGTSEDRKGGLSQMIIDLKLPGVTVRPIPEISGDAHFCEVFFDNVYIEDDALLGEEGNGWSQVTAELALERSGPDRIFSSMILYEEWLAFIRTPQGYSPNSERTAGAILAQIAPLRAMSIAITARINIGDSPSLEAALVKDLGTTLEQIIPRLIAEDILSRDLPSVPASLLEILNLTELTAPWFSIRGGTREILRSIIARSMI